MRHARTTILNRGDPEEKREEIRRYFHDTFSLDEQLYETLADEKAFYMRPEPLRHPLIFYLGHTAAFYINKLIAGKISGRRINPGYESMFAIGVDEMSWDDLNESHYDWPTLDEVKSYRREVRDFVDETIARMPLSIPVGWDDPFWLIMMGIEHQRIHIETSSVIIRRLPIEMVRQLPLWEICPESGEAPKNELVPVAGGRVVLGKPYDHPLYGWDNEYGRRESDVWDFSAGRYLVSNREFLGFVEDGGYGRDEFWTEEGRQWVEFSRLGHPLFWVDSPDGYRFRTLARIIDMPWNWPVEVNYLEAKAFCNWMAQNSGEPIRLPSEAEWRRLYDLCDIPDQPYWPQAPGNINLEHWASSCPINRFSFGEFCDVIGNVWQWTETPISGFDGFRIHPAYDDFSTPTFDTKHNLIKGGSWISTGNEATRDSRYAFRRHFFQHAGFRYVRSTQPLDEPAAMYETDREVAQSCEAHYGRDYFDVPNFPLRLAAICLRYMQDRSRGKALDLGCSAGRATFELAKHFEHVTGIDFSARFIRVGLQLVEKGVFHYELLEEGEIVSYRAARLSDNELDTWSGRVEFVQGDAINLKPQFSGYDLILADDLLDRLSDPKRFLAQIHERLNVGGILVIASPYDWAEQFTKKDNWPGGIRKDGEPYTTLQSLADLLGPHFAMLDEPQDVEHILRVTARKFEYFVSQVTVWQRIR